MSGEVQLLFQPWCRVLEIFRARGPAVLQGGVAIAQHGDSDAKICDGVPEERSESAVKVTFDWCFRCAVKMPGS